MLGSFPELRLTLLRWWEQPITDWLHDPLALPYWRLYWNHEPGAAVIYDTRRWPISPEQALLIAPETVFHTDCRSTITHVYAHFTISGLPWHARPGMHAIAMTPLLRATIEAARAAHHDRDANACQWSATAWSAACLATWPEHLRHADQVTGVMADACAYLRQRLDRQVTNDEVAARTGMNTNAFIRAFKQATGCPPQHWHHQQRIEAACIDLAEGELHIDDIAESLGYCDRHHFSRVFKRHRGIAPAAYRASAQAHRI